MPFCLVQWCKQIRHSLHYPSTGEHDASVVTYAGICNNNHSKAKTPKTLAHAFIYALFSLFTFHISIRRVHAEHSPRRMGANGSIVSTNLVFCPLSHHLYRPPRTVHIVVNHHTIIFSTPQSLETSFDLVFLFHAFCSLLNLVMVRLCSFLFAS